MSTQEHNSSLTQRDPQHQLHLKHTNALKRLDALISHENPAEVVHALEPFQLYHLILEVGTSDALELIHLASDEQTQAFLDFDCWHRSELRADKLARWAEIFLQIDDDKHFARTIHNLDPEIPAILFKVNLRVYLLDKQHQPPPELVELDLPYEVSPDNTYAIVYPEDEDRARTMRSLVKRLYASDFTLARTLLEAARWELLAPMHEHAHQARKNRLEALGFVDLYDALELYAFRDPNAVKASLSSTAPPKPQDDAPSPPPNTALPELYSDNLNPASFFYKALKTLSQRTDLQPDKRGVHPVDQILWDLTLLNNRSASANFVEPGNPEALKRLFASTQGTLSIALQFLCERNIQRASETLLSTHVKTLFQTGHSLLLKLSKQTQLLLQNPSIPPTLSILDDSPLSLLSPPDRSLVANLMRKRPLYAPADNPELPDHFNDLSQVEETAARLSILTFKLLTLTTTLRLDLEAIASAAYTEGVQPPVEAITIDTLLTTALCNHLLPSATPSPITPIPIPQLADLHTKWLPDASIFPDTPAPRPASQLAFLDNTPIALKTLTLFTQDATLPSHSLPLARVLTRRLVETLCEALMGLSATDLSSGAIRAEHLGDFALLLNLDN